MFQQPVRLLILYASQTGTSEDIAENTAHEANRYYFNSTVHSLDDYDRGSLIEEKLVLFFISTTGDGEEPDNMKSFWKFLLKKSLPQGILSKLHFAVFGLGDSGYQKFNYPSKKLFNRLLQLGANPILPRGDGDDQHPLGLDGGLAPFMTSFWSKLLEMYPLPEGVKVLDDDTLAEPCYKIDINCTKSLHDEDLSNRQHSNVKTYSGTVSENKRITAASHFQDVRHIRLSCDENVDYLPGDVVSVTPKNLPDDVNAVIEHFGWTDIATSPIIITVRDDTLIAPSIKKLVSKFAESANSETPLTLVELLTNLNIFGIPKRKQLKYFSKFTTDELYITKLQELSNGIELLEYIQKPKRTIFEVLQDFHITNIPVDYVIEIFGPIKPRLFSICSSPKVLPKSVEMTVGIVEFKTMMKKKRTGVCTKWMSGWKVGQNVEFVIQRGTFKVPESERGVVLIGVGTGIAPMRSIWMDREYERDVLGKKVGETVIITGNRYHDKDYLYGEELRKMKDVKMISAFSREGSEKKEYVQDKIEEKGEIMKGVIERGGLVMLSGRSEGMPQKVKEKVKGLVEIKESQWQQECW